jgi:tetratricopeptide (TPR) repeat protein
MAPLLDTPVPGAREQASSADPFVGRARELDVLGATLDAVIAGQGRILLVSGEPGIGKTRLAEELADRARAVGAVVAWGRSWEGEGAAAYWPWVQIVRSYIQGRDADEVRADAGDAAADIARVMPDLGRHLGLAPPPLDAEARRLQPEQDRFRFFDGFARFLAAAARRQPLVLILDDLQSADTPSLLLLQFVARAIAEARILVLCAHRLVDLGPDHPLLTALADLGRARGTHRLPLIGLEQDEIASFVRAIAGRSPAPRLLTALSEQTEGNPFFLREVVQLLAADGKLTGDDATPWRLTIPSGVHQAIARRLAPLPLDCRRLLELAAPLGRAVDLAVLQVLHAGEDGEARDVPVLHVLEPALRAGLAREVAPGVCSFGHALVQESLYARLSPSRLARLHHRAATAFEAVYAAEVDAHLTEIAYHYAHAGNDSDVRGRALEYARRAGEQALQRLAYEEAARSYRGAIDIVRGRSRADGELQIELLLALAEAQMRAGDVAGAREAEISAAEIARRFGLVHGFARAALGSGWFFSRQGNDPVRIALLEEALRGLPQDDDPLRAKVMGRLALSLCWSDTELARRFDLSAEALEMARRLGDPSTLAFTLNTRLYSLWGPSDVEAQLAMARELVAVAEAGGEQEVALQGRHWVVTYLLQLGLLEEADHEIAVYTHVAETLRLPLYRWFAATWRAMRTALDGQFEEAERLSERAAEIGAQSEPENATSVYFALLYLSRRELGRLDEIAPFLEQEMDSGEFKENYLAGVGFILAEAGRLAEARRTIERLRNSRFGKFDNGWMSTHAAAAEACAILGDVEFAARLYEDLSPFRTQNVVVGMGVVVFGSVARHLGLLATTLGRFDEADAHFAAALAMHERLRSRPLCARTQHDWAAMLTARDAPGDGERARRLLVPAIESARLLGMRVLLEQALALQERLGEPARPAPRLAVAPSNGNSAARLRRDGDHWTFVHGGRILTLRDSKGLQYLAHLLAHPRHEFHVLDLARGPSEPAAPATPRESSLEVLDQAAKAAYRRRLAELGETLEEAERLNDRGRAEAARAEIDALTEQLATAVGLGRRDRTAPSATERARSAVTKRLREVLARIALEHPALGDHLSRRIQTGTFCSYAPDLTGDLEWIVTS